MRARGNAPGSLSSVTRGVTLAYNNKISALSFSGLSTCFYWRSRENGTSNGASKTYAHKPALPRTLNAKRNSPPLQTRSAPASNLEHAFYLARNHIPVFPCNDDKTPRTANGFKDATTDERKIRRWWGPWPEALIGVPAGIKFDVVDLDLQHPEAQAWLADHPPPETRVHHTRSGGLHYLFQPTAGLRNSVSKLARGVDVRARGGYIIWWPAQGFEVSNPDELAEIPRAILTALADAEKEGSRRNNYSEWSWGRDAEERLGALVRFIVEAEEGERNARLYWAARRFVEIVAEDGVEEGWAREVLLEAGIYTGLPHRECIATIRSAFQNLEVRS
jgi:Bifunctional DNA primase/polymerase, N-terminal